MCGATTQALVEEMPQLEGQAGKLCEQLVTLPGETAEQQEKARYLEMQSRELCLAAQQELGQLEMAGDFVTQLTTSTSLLTAWADQAEPLLKQEVTYSSIDQVNVTIKQLQVCNLKPQCTLYHRRVRARVPSTIAYEYILWTIYSESFGKL